MDQRVDQKIDQRLAKSHVPGQYLDIALVQGQYLDIALEAGQYKICCPAGALDLPTQSVTYLYICSDLQEIKDPGNYND